MRVYDRIRGVSVRTALSLSFLALPAFFLYLFSFQKEAHQNERQPVQLATTISPETSAPETSKTSSEIRSVSEDPSIDDPIQTEHRAFSSVARFGSRQIIIKDLVLKPGNTLGALLEQANTDRGDVVVALEALKTIYDPRRLKAGQKITLYLEAPLLHKASTQSSSPMRLAAITTRPSVERTVAVNRLHSGEFEAYNITIEFEKEIVRAEGDINNSLYADALAAGATDKLIAQFAKIYAYSVDFQRGLLPGDHFEMVFERFKNEEGQTVKTGKLLYAMLAPKGQKKAYWRFETADGETGFYDALGKSAKRFLMKTPINGARLSSRFGRRRHPILGYTRMHKGVDFAASRGTPILAAGGGLVVHAGRRGSYGNYVRLRHVNGYETAYAHASRIAKGIKKGKRVKQGQVIAYVGSTGRSTGPHLHYEVLKAGKQVNPLNIKAPTGRSLSKKEKQAFELAKKNLDTLRQKAGPAKQVRASLYVARSEENMP